MSFRLTLRPLTLLLALACALPVLAQQATPAPDGVLVSEDTLDGYAGRYATATGIALKVWRDGAVLKLQPEGGAPVTLVADSETTFHASGMDAHVEFVFDASDRISHLFLTQGGTTVKAIHQANQP
ncbi:hypothetical protein [Pseudoxanthomonas sp.]|uniref:hypothetical protein n=1 Tax=Pseudoxanthomonas sp. TaxID=1871049 RepID=UPI002624E9F8|nr:hypothetical protein [Pseudoxanthomonas sp.]WDS34596.1 MAG: hypothetical protein O8I58_09295 [Pseudoxanthomonas sp.]